MKTKVSLPLFTIQHHVDPLLHFCQYKHITYTSREIDHQRDEKREYKSYGSLVWEGLGFE